MKTVVKDDYFKKNHEVSYYFWDSKEGMVYKDVPTIEEASRGIYRVNRNLTEIGDLDTVSKYEKRDSIHLISADQLKMIGRGEYFVEIRPSIEELKKMGANDGVYSKEFVEGLIEMMNPDAIRENALKAGGFVERQYIYSRMASEGISAAITRPFLGTLTLKKGGGASVDRRVDQDYSKKAVEAVEHEALDIQRIPQQKWETMYETMKGIIRTESRNYRDRREQGQTDSEVEIGMISGRGTPKANIEIKGPKEPRGGKHSRKYIRGKLSPAERDDRDER